MLSIPTLTAFKGQEISVPITQTDGAGGIQFDLVYDPAALEFVRWDKDVLTDPVTNPQPGRFRYVVSKTEALPETLGYIVFIAHADSSLAFENAVMGTTLGQAIDITGTNAPKNGAILIEGIDMNFEAFWDAPPSGIGIVGTRVFVGESADKNDGTFQLVADVAQPSNTAPFSLGGNIGDRFAYCFHYDAQFPVSGASGDRGPGSSVVQFSTDAAIPAPSGFGVRVV